MNRLSVNLIWSSQLLLKRIHKFKICRADEIYLSNISDVSVDNILELSQSCNWVAVTENGDVEISRRGRDILECQDMCSCSQMMLHDYICKLMPSWAKRIPFGRQEAYIFMNKDEQACFCEAGLMQENPEISVVRWWDRISNHIRSLENENNNDEGRNGELFTIDYELKRTGVKPLWASIESNLSGYDVISQLSAEDTTRLLIEVKCSGQSLENAGFYISSGEWFTAINSLHYQFHLWNIAEKNKLAILTPQQINPFIPTNNETGEWRKARIPYASFAHLFVTI